MDKIFKYCITTCQWKQVFKDQQKAHPNCCKYSGLLDSEKKDDKMLRKNGENESFLSFHTEQHS